MRIQKFKWWKAFRKGILPAVGAYAATQVANYNLGDVLSNPQEQLPNIGTALLVGLVPAIVNTWKNRDKEGNPFYSPPGIYRGYLLLILPALAASGALAGCITTTGPDGTVTRQVDPAITDQLTIDNAWALWESIQAEKAELEAKRAAAKAEDRAALERQIRVLSQAADDAWDAWLAAGGKVEVRVSAP